MRRLFMIASLHEMFGDVERDPAEMGGVCAQPQRYALSLQQLL
jgi:hypothetical protein